MHGTVEAVQSPEEAALRASGMQLFVSFLVIGFLEDLVGAYACRFYDAESLDVQGCGVDIYPANLAIIVLGVIDGLHRFGDVFRAVNGVFTIDHDQALVANIDQGFGVLDQLLLAQGGSFAFLVGNPESAVNAVVYTLVSYIERGKEHDAVAIDLLFEVSGTLQYHFPEFGVLDGEQGCGFIRIEPVFGQRFGDDVAYPGFRCIAFADDQVFDGLGGDERFDAFSVDFHFRKLLRY